MSGRSSARDGEVAQLLVLLDQAFERKSWHGPNLRGSIRGLSAADATWRPGAGRHCIAEIAVHAAYWKYAVRRRLTGEKRGSFALVGSNWFPVEASYSEQSWHKHVAMLQSEHRQLRDAVADLLAKDLPGRPAGGKVTRLDLIHGIAAHDLYHAGQIQTIKGLMKNRK